MATAHVIAGYTSTGLTLTRGDVGQPRQRQHGVAIAIENRNQALASRTPEVQEFMARYRERVNKKFAPAHEVTAPGSPTGCCRRVVDKGSQTTCAPAGCRPHAVVVLTHPGDPEQLDPPPGQPHAAAWASGTVQPRIVNGAGVSCSTRLTRSWVPLQGVEDAREPVLVTERQAEHPAEELAGTAIGRRRERHDRSGPEHRQPPIRSTTSPPQQQVHHGPLLPDGYEGPTATLPAHDTVGNVTEGEGEHIDAASCGHCSTSGRSCSSCTGTRTPWTTATKRPGSTCSHPTPCSTSSRRSGGRRIHREEGRDDLAAYVAAYPKPPAFRKHVIVDPVVEVDGDEARVESYWILLHREQDDGLPVLAAFGRSTDRVVRLDGEWRIARSATPRWRRPRSPPEPRRPSDHGLNDRGDARCGRSASSSPRPPRGAVARSRPPSCDGSTPSTTWSSCGPSSSRWRSRFRAIAVEHLGPILHVDNGLIARDSPIGLGARNCASTPTTATAPSRSTGISLLAIDVVDGETSTRFAVRRTRTSRPDAGAAERLARAAALQVFGARLDVRNRLADLDPRLPRPRTRSCSPTPGPAGPSCSRRR